MFKFFKKKIVEEPPIDEIDELDDIEGKDEIEDDQDWRLMTTLECGVSLSNRGIVSDHGKLYYHLLESDKGQRKIELGCTLVLNDNEIFLASRRMPLYHETVYPWLKGRYSPDIPRYADVPYDDTVKALKGTSIKE
jgi:hypothetical protein